MFGKYIRNLLIFTIVTGLAGLILSLVLPVLFVTPAWPFLFLFFFSVSVISSRYLLKAREKKFIRFVNSFMITIILKLFFYAAIMFSYAMIYREDAVPFLLWFFVLYLLFTIFETIGIIRQNGQPGESR